MIRVFSSRPQPSFISARLIFRGAEASGFQVSEQDFSHQEQQIQKLQEKYQHTPDVLENAKEAFRLLHSQDKLSQDQKEQVQSMLEKKDVRYAFEKLQQISSQTEKRLLKLAGKRGVKHLESLEKSKNFQNFSEQFLALDAVTKRMLLDDMPALGEVKKHLASFGIPASRSTEYLFAVFRQPKVTPQILIRLLRPYGANWTDQMFTDIWDGTIDTFPQQFFEAIGRLHNLLANLSWPEDQNFTSLVQNYQGLSEGEDKGFQEDRTLAKRAIIFFRKTLGLSYDQNIQASMAELEQGVSLKLSFPEWIMQDDAKSYAEQKADACAIYDISSEELDTFLVAQGEVYQQQLQSDLRNQIFTSPQERRLIEQLLTPPKNISQQEHWQMLGTLSLHQSSHGQPLSENRAIRDKFDHAAKRLFLQSELLNPQYTTTNDFLQEKINWLQEKIEMPTSPLSPAEIRLMNVKLEALELVQQKNTEILSNISLHPYFEGIAQTQLDRRKVESQIIRALLLHIGTTENFKSIALSADQLARKITPHIWSGLAAGIDLGNNHTLFLGATIGRGYTALDGAIAWTQNTQVAGIPITIGAGVSFDQAVAFVGKEHQQQISFMGRFEQLALRGGMGIGTRGAGVGLEVGFQSDSVTEMWNDAAKKMNASFPNMEVTATYNAATHEIDLTYNLEKIREHLQRSPDLSAEQMSDQAVLDAFRPILEVKYFAAMQAAQPQLFSGFGVVLSPHILPIPYVQFSRGGRVRFTQRNISEYVHEQRLALLRDIDRENEEKIAQLFNRSEILVESDSKTTISTQLTDGKRNFSGMSLETSEKKDLIRLFKAPFIDIADTVDVLEERNMPGSYVIRVVLKNDLADLTHIRFARDAKVWRDNQSFYLKLPVLSDSASGEEIQKALPRIQSIKNYQHTVGSERVINITFAGSARVDPQNSLQWGKGGLSASLSSSVEYFDRESLDLSRIELKETQNISSRVDLSSEEIQKYVSLTVNSVQNDAQLFDSLLSSAPLSAEKFFASEFAAGIKEHLSQLPIPDQLQQWVAFDVFQKIRLEKINQNQQSLQQVASALITLFKIEPYDQLFDRLLSDDLNSDEAEQNIISQLISPDFIQDGRIQKNPVWILLHQPAYRHYFFSTLKTELHMVGFYDRITKEGFRVTEKNTLSHLFENSANFFQKIGVPTELLDTYLTNSEDTGDMQSHQQHLLERAKKIRQDTKNTEFGVYEMLDQEKTYLPASWTAYVAGKEGVISLSVVAGQQFAIVEEETLSKSEILLLLQSEQVKSSLLAEWKHVDFAGMGMSDKDLEHLYAAVSKSKELPASVEINGQIFTIDFSGLFAKAFTGIPEKSDRGSCYNPLFALNAKITKIQEFGESTLENIEIYSDQTFQKGGGICLEKPVISITTSGSVQKEQRKAGDTHTGTGGDDGEGDTHTGTGGDGNDGDTHGSTGGNKRK